MILFSREHRTLPQPVVLGKRAKLLIRKTGRGESMPALPVHLQAARAGFDAYTARLFGFRADSILNRYSHKSAPVR